MIEYTVPLITEGGIIQHMLAIMDKYDIEPADIARALDMKEPTVRKWFKIPTRGEKRLTEIIRGLDIVLSKKGINITDAAGYPSRLDAQTGQVRGAMRKSIEMICGYLDAVDMQTLESVAWSLYQQEHPYPAFYERGADIIAADGGKDENGNQTVKIIPTWCTDDVLYKRDQIREAAESAHAKAEALANETIETTPDDPTGGRWDVYERRRNEHDRADIAAQWRQWADSRPTDMPMMPEFRQLLAILELEAPTADQTADDAEEGAEPAQ